MTGKHKEPLTIIADDVTDTTPPTEEQRRSAERFFREPFISDAFFIEPDSELSDRKFRRLFLNDWRKP